MRALDHVQALYEYNEWANEHVLKAASALSDDEFGRDLGASFGSVEGSLAHIVAGQTVWLQRWTSGSNPKSLMELQAIRGLPAIEAEFAESHAGLREYVAGLTDENLDRVLHYRDSRGEAHERPMWQLLVHLANHGTHHRAEAAMLLTSLGSAPRELDYHFFELERS